MPHTGRSVRAFNNTDGIANRERLVCFLHNDGPVAIVHLYGYFKAVFFRKLLFRNRAARRSDKPAKNGSNRFAGAAADRAPNSSACRPPGQRADDAFCPFNLNLVYLYDPAIGNVHGRAGLVACIHIARAAFSAAGQKDKKQQWPQVLSHMHDTSLNIVGYAAISFMFYVSI
jgi:hypothetical protein